MAARLLAFKKAPPDPEAGYYLAQYYGKRAAKGEPRATLEKLLALVPDGFGALVLAPAFVLLLAALYCSFWPTYRDTVDPIAADPAA